MKLEYILEKRHADANMKDDRGRSLLTTDFSIVDCHRSENGKPLVLDDWQAVYVLEDQESEEKQQIEIAKNHIQTLIGYVTACHCMQEKAKLQNRIELNESNSEIDEETKKLDQKNLTSVDRELEQYAHSVEIVCCALAYHEVSILEVNENWIAENMVNDGLFIMCKSNLLEKYHEMA